MITAGLVLAGILSILAGFFAAYKIDQIIVLLEEAKKDDCEELA